MYRAIIKKGQTWKNLGNRWQINSALIAKIDLMFLITDLQVATDKHEKSIGLFFIVDFDL